MKRNDGIYSIFHVNKLQVTRNTRILFHFLVHFKVFIVECALISIYAKQLYLQFFNNYEYYKTGRYKNSLVNVSRFFANSVDKKILYSRHDWKKSTTDLILNGEIDLEATSLAFLF